MDVMAFLYLLVLTVSAALGYGLWSFFTSLKPTDQFQIQRLIATIVFSVVIGILMALAGVDPQNMDPTTIAGFFAMYTTLLFYINKAIDAIWEKYYGKKFMEPVPAGPP